MVFTPNLFIAASTVHAAGTTDAAQSTISVNNSTVKADGTTATITVTLKDNVGAAIDVSGGEHNVSLSHSGSSIIDQTPVTTTAGVATFTVHNTNNETDTFTATDTTDVVLLSNSVNVTFDSVSPTAAITYSINHAVKSGASQTITATFTENIVNTPKVTLSAPASIAAASMTSTADPKVFTYDYSVGSGDGTVTVSLSAGTDAAGNVVTSAPTSGSTFVIDNTAPVITINGTDPMSVNYGNTFTDTVTVSDNVDGTITNNIVVGGSVNTSVIGGYNLTYDVTDAAGNSAVQKTRTVNVVQRPLTVSATGVDKVYDGTTSATVNLTSNKLNTDTVTLSYTSATFNTENVGSGKTVSVSGISIGGADASKYSLSNVTASTTADVTIAPLTVTANNQTKAYDNVAYSGGNGVVYSGFVNGETSAVLGGTLSYGGTSQGATNAGTFTDSWTFTDSTGNYNNTSGTVSDTINKASAVLSVFGYTGAYDGAAHGASGTATGVGGVDLFSFLNLGNTFTNVPGGVASWTFNAGTNYNTDSGSVNIDITKANQTITFNALSAKNYGDANFTVSATASSGLTVTFTSQTTNVCTVSGTTVSILNAGTCTIAADQAGDSNYNAAPQVTRSFTVNTLPLTITAAAKTKVYGASDPSLTYTVTSGSLINADQLTGSLTRNSGENVGTYAITQGTVTAGSNYTITYNGANLTITAKTLTVTATGVNKTYDGTTSATVILSHDAINGDDVTVAYTSATFANKNVGTGKTVSVTGISITGGAAQGNYTLGNTTASTTADITALAITVSANANNKWLGASDPTFTYSVSPSLMNGDSFTGTLSRVTGTTAGTYAITVGTLSAGSNYNQSFVSANFKILALPVITNPLSGTTTTQNPTITVTTTDPAACTYSVDSTTPATMTTTGSTNHSQSLSNLSNGSHALSIVCTDTLSSSSTTVTTNWAVMTANGGTIDTSTISPSFDSTNAGEANLPAGITSLNLSSSTALDLTDGLDGTFNSNPTIAGSPVNLATPLVVGGQSVNLTQSVTLQSGTNGTAITLTNTGFSNASLSIPDGATLMAPAGWNGQLSAPKGGSESGSVQTGFNIGGTVYEFGSSNTALLFDTPVSVVLPGVSGKVAYKVAGDSAWTEITNNCSGTYANPTAPVFPGECKISNGSDTKVYTYHLTTFAQLNIQSCKTDCASPIAPYTGGGNPDSGSQVLAANIAQSTPYYYENSRGSSAGDNSSEDKVEGATTSQENTPQSTIETATQKAKENKKLIAAAAAAILLSGAGAYYYTRKRD